MKMKLKNIIWALASAYALVSCREKLQEYKPVTVLNVSSPTIVPSATTVTRLARAVSVESADTASQGFSAGQPIAINPRIFRLDTLIAQRIVTNGGTMEISAKVNLGTASVPFKGALVNFRFGTSQSQFRFQTTSSVYNSVDSTLKIVIQIPSSIAPIAGAGTSPSPLVLRYAVINQHDSISNVIEEPLTIVQAGGTGANFLLQYTWRGVDLFFADTLNCQGTRHSVVRSKNTSGVVVKFLPNGTVSFSEPFTHFIARCHQGAPSALEIALPTKAGWQYNSRTREITLIYSNSIQQIWHIKEYNNTYFEAGNRSETDVLKYRYRFTAQ
ncbi:MAG: hypothetical protein NZM38_10965 [Cytophagales bacterium]|nr:hypothetical protein [Cytophagales bacterium]MDW8385275.1 hypothetical protein [Flammeovirgaceae bacterium]